MIRCSTAISLLCAAGAIGCGGGGGDDSAGTVTVTSTSTQTTTQADSEQTQGAAAHHKPLSRGARAEAIVERYYAAVAAGRYGDAWKLLSPGLQGELGGYGAWKDGYATTVATKASGVHATAVSSASVTVALTLNATDVDACGDTVDQTFTGTWTLTPAARDFLGTAFAVDKTSGGTPATDASACAGSGGGSVPVGPAGCDPNYTGCVPPYPPDVDCIDVRQEVDVIGQDVHNLDLGGDGQACEIYFK